MNAKKRQHVHGLPAGKNVVFAKATQSIYKEVFHFFELFSQEKLE